MINFGTVSKPPATKSIVNYYSSGGVAFDGNLQTTTTGKNTLSGALTANTYKDIVTVTGAGVLHSCAAIAVDATSRTIGIKIVIDGTAVFDAVSSAVTAQYDGLVAIGILDPGAYVSLPVDIFFNSSLVISVKSSLSETDKVTLIYAYETR